MSQTESKKEYGVQRLRKAKFETPTGKPTRSSGFEYIKYGDDNKYPHFLEGLLQQAEHNAIVDAKSDWIAREGFNLESLPPTLQTWFIDNDMDSLVYKLAKDLEIFGGFCFYVTKTRDGSTVATLEYEDFKNIRVPQTDDGETVSELLVSNNWHKIRTTNVERVPIWENGTSEPRSMFYYVGNSKDVYPSPSYYGGIAAIQTGIEIDNFHLNHVKNGFFIPLVINFNNGIPDDERQDEIVRDVKLSFSGTDNAGEPLISFNESKESAVSIESFEPADLDKKFEVLNSQIQQKVLSSHRITSPQLIGIKTEGQLGGRAELLDAWELIKINYIKPRQYTLCSVIKTVLGINDVDLELVIQPPIEEELDKDVLTIEERRELQGMSVDEMSDQQRTIIALKQLPQELRQRFIENLTTEEINRIVGYEPETENIDTEE